MASDSEMLNDDMNAFCFFMFMLTLLAGTVLLILCESPSSPLSPPPPTPAPSRYPYFDAMMERQRKGIYTVPEDDQEVTLKKDLDGEDSYLLYALVFVLVFVCALLALSFYFGYGFSAIGYFFSTVVHAPNANEKPREAHCETACSTTTRPSMVSPTPVTTRKTTHAPKIAQGTYCTPLIIRRTSNAPSMLDPPKMPSPPKILSSLPPLRVRYEDLIVSREKAMQALLSLFPPEKSPMTPNEVPMSEDKSKIEEVEKVEERRLPPSFFASPEGERSPRVEGSQTNFSPVFRTMPMPINLKHCTRRSHKTAPKVLSASEITQVAPRNAKAADDYLAPMDVDVVPDVAIQKQVSKTSEPSGFVSRNQVMSRTDLQWMSLSDVSQAVRKNAGEYLAPMDIDSPVVTDDYLAPMEL